MPFSAWVNTKKQKIRIVIADAGSRLQNLYEKMLRYQPEIEIVGYAFNETEALSLTLDLKPDVLLINFHLRLLRTLPTIKEVQQKAPSVELIGLTLLENSAESRIVEMLGLKCIPVKSDCPEKVYQTICEYVKLGKQTC